ncbi:MAG: AAA family ATPase, partial [Planctomycetes bacterium]|nr:AAA family ATPase [Planctomycetota bacterium]
MSRVAHTGSLFEPRRPGSRRVAVTGQVGVDKKPFLEKLAEMARSRNQPCKLFHVGDLMYAEAPDVRPGRILDLPLARLTSLRRAVFKDVITEANQHSTSILNTHAAFRWKHGLFPAFDHDQMAAFDADIYITLVDNLDAIHERLTRDHDLPHSLKDILVWREEEILATEILAQAVRGHGCYYVFSRGVD